jgi:hypothetical protein
LYPAVGTARTGSRRDREHPPARCLKPGDGSVAGDAPDPNNGNLFYPNGHTTTCTRKAALMGRTTPTATQVLLQEEAAFSRFRRALRRADQLALDDLFTSARQHLAAAQYASHALPFEVFLLSMLIEEHKQVMLLRQQMEDILARLK